jgi:8-oxo-dGTP pyrophosphatase MutT (NUDIX family)
LQFDVGEDVVRAAGGVVWRRNASDVELILVHRPAYDDWSIPKGKLHAGETEKDAAVREVEEETGLRCRLGPELGTTSYHDDRNRMKTVRYWQMRPLTDEAPAPANEIDDARWVLVEQASRMLSYDRDRRLLAGFEPKE